MQSAALSLRELPGEDAIRFGRQCRDKPRPLEIIGDSARITLTRGYHAWVDAADHDLVAGRNWVARAYNNRDVVYAATRIGDKMVTLHRYLLKPEAGFEIDHVDHDGLNNRRSNLRVATKAENRWNTKVLANSTSGIKGVSYDHRRGNFRARIKVNGVAHYLGVFATAEEAGAAYAEAAKRLHGSFAFCESVRGAA